MLKNTLKLNSPLCLLLLLPLLPLKAQTTERFLGAIGVSSSGTFVVPCGVNQITIKAWGGGGGGGATPAVGGGCGGGGGGYCESTIAVVPGQSFAYTAGAGGVGGTSGGAGGNGGFSSFGAGFMRANGGTGGGTLGGTPGTGGTATGGTTSNFSGYDGYAGTASAGAAGGNNGLSVGAGRENTTANTLGSFGSVGGGGGGGFSTASPRDDGGAGGLGQIIVSYAGPNAGSDQSLPCGTTSTAMTANLPAPIPGAVGTWTRISGTGTIVSANSPTTSITGLTAGTCSVFRWTWTGGGVGCRTVSDDVTICIDGTAQCNDNPCTARTLTVNTAHTCVNTAFNNVNSTATTNVYAPEPGCGSWSDNDVWFQLTVPPNGTVTVRGADIAGGGSFYVGMALYTGTSCNNLMHQGCNFTTALATPVEMNYVGTPGETLYIRVWNYLDAEDATGFNICAFSRNNLACSICPGDAVNTINCGGSYNFVDPGGASNDYRVNQSAYYEICPSDTSQYVSVTFSSFAIGAGDQLTVMNGNLNYAPIIYNLTSTTTPAVPFTITSSNPTGCLQFAFLSNDLTVAAGWNSTVTCSAVPGVNNVNAFESKTNCNRRGDILVCADGDYDIENNGLGATEEMGIQVRGCWDNNGEITNQSAWFYFQISTAGSLDMSFQGPNGHDYDFAIYGPNTNHEIPCPMSTGDGPIRCSYANTPNPVGLGVNPNTGVMATDFIEDVAGDGWLAPLNVAVGETYALVFNIYQNGNPQPVIDLSFGGTATMDCTPVMLAVSKFDFKGINQGNSNFLTWITQSETLNDYFIVQRSADGISWSDLGIVDGAGTTDYQVYYTYTDPAPFFPTTYYRLEMVDLSQVRKLSKTIAIESVKNADNTLISDLFPNPTTDEFFFTYSGTDEQTPIDVQLFNSVGQLVYQTSISSFGAGQTLSVPTHNLAAGVYQVAISQGQLHASKRLCVLR